jgi:hypothetical protein
MAEGDRERLSGYSPAELAGAFEFLSRIALDVRKSEVVA